MGFDWAEFGKQGNQQLTDYVLQVFPAASPLCLQLP